MLSFIALWLSFVTYAIAASSRHSLELTWRKGSPDGFTREMFFINGGFPGPTLDIKQGDWVEITVINKTPFPSSIHFHGIEQLNTPWADGVPGITQRSIQPGGRFTYKWLAEQYGSYFYHAHSRGQIEDGCYGPIIIKPKTSISKPFSKIASAEVGLLKAAESAVIPVVLSDWRHTTSERTWELQVASGLESSICMDSLLVNGKGAVGCWSREDITKFTNPGIGPVLQQFNLSMTDKGCLPPEALQILLAGGSETHIDALPPDVFKVCKPTQGSRELIKFPRDKKWLALDLINSAGIDTFVFSIDEHPLWIYAVDGHYIEPMKVDALTLVNGDRYSVFIKANKRVTNYGIRVAAVGLAQLIDTTAVLGYEGNSYGYTMGNGAQKLSSTPSVNQAGFPISAKVVFLDSARIQSFPAQFPQPPPKVDQTFIMSLAPAGKSYVWVLNGTAYDHAIDNRNPPLLYQPPSEDSIGRDITITTKNNTWVDLVFRVTTLNQPGHPIHKHSNKGFIIGQGDGEFNYTTVAQAAAAMPQNFNFVTPPYRDGFVTPPSITKPTWLAVRYHVVNPGAFLLHCHIQSHMNGGMSMVILDGTNEWPKVPKEYQN